MMRSHLEIFVDADVYKDKEASMREGNDGYMITLFEFGVSYDFLKQLIRYSIQQLLS